MDDQDVPNVENVAIEQESVPWIDKIRVRTSRNDLIIRTHLTSEPFNDARAIELARAFSGQLIDHLSLDLNHLNPTSEGTKTLAASLEEANIQKLSIHSSNDNGTQLLGVLLAALNGHPTLSWLILLNCSALGDDLAAFVESRPPNLTEIKLRRCDLADPFNPRLLRCIGRAVHDRYLSSFEFEPRNAHSNVQPNAHIRLSSLPGVELLVVHGESVPSQWIKDLLTDCCDLRHVTLLGRTSLVPVMHRSIEKLSLHELHCSLEVAYSLDSFLRTRAGTLKELDLRNLNMDIECWQVVIPGMAVSHGLSSLSVDACIEYVPGRGPLIGRVLRSCPQLTSLTLKENLRSADVHLFIEDLRTNRTLKSLSLAGNRIDSVDTLADYWSHNPSLETLDLSSNEIVDLTPLFRMLVDRQAPTDLFLAGNPCNNHGWDALSEAMKSGARLRKLRLSVNPFDDADCVACIRFIRGMESQLHLKELSLNWDWPGRSFANVDEQEEDVLGGDVLECLIRVIGSLRFLETLSFELSRRMLYWNDWKDTLLGAVKQNESLMEISVEGIWGQDFQDSLKFYSLRNKVNRTLKSSSRGLWGDMLLQLNKWPQVTVGLSNMFLAFKTHTALIETAGRSRSTKRPRALAEEDEDSARKSRVMRP